MKKIILVILSIFIISFLVYKTIFPYFALGFILSTGRIGSFLVPLLYFVSLPAIFVERLFSSTQQYLSDYGLRNIEESSIVLEENLVHLDCFSPSDVMLSGFQEQDLEKYNKELNGEQYNIEQICKNNKVNFVIVREFLDTNSSNESVKVYADVDNKIMKVINYVHESTILVPDYYGNPTLSYPEITLAKDGVGNLILLKYGESEGKIYREPFAYDSEKSKFLKVVQFPNAVEVCKNNKDNECISYALKPITE